MRRLLSILLVLVFGFGPLSATLESEDARLPPCCRAHGTHQCGMSARLMARIFEAWSHTTNVHAPASCPLYRTFYDQSFATEQAALPAVAAAHAASADEAVSIAIARLRLSAAAVAHAPRGPPVTTFA